jgi:hypothetical protein
MRVIYAAIALATLAGCTTYTETSLFGGVSAMQVNERTWELTSRGNVYASEKQINDYLLLKAAEIALDNGFTHFVPLQRGSKLTQFAYSTSGSATSAPSFHTYNKPSGSMLATFIAVEHASGTPPDAMSASLIYAQLGPRYVAKDKLRVLPQSAASNRTSP